MGIDGARVLQWLSYYMEWKRLYDPCFCTFRIYDPYPPQTRRIIHKSISYESEAWIWICPAALMNREVAPDLDTCVQEVWREELQLQSPHVLTEDPKAFIAQLAEEATLLTPQGSKVQCFECKGSGHVAHSCKMKIFCNNYEKSRHVISKSTRHPSWKYE